MIAGGITLLFSLAYFSCVHTSIYVSSDGYACEPFLVTSPLYPFVYLFDRTYENLPLPSAFIIISILSISLWFVLGSCVGLVFGWIRIRPHRSK